MHITNVCVDFLQASSSSTRTSVRFCTVNIKWIRQLPFFILTCRIDSAWVLSNPQEKCADACVRVYGAGQTCDSAFMSELTDETKFLYVAGLLQLTIDSTDIPPNDCAPGVIGNFGLLAFISGASCLAPCSGAGQDAIQLFCCCSSDPAACPTS